MTAVKQEFIHKVDKAKIPTCNILGVDIAALIWCGCLTTSTIISTPYQEITYVCLMYTPP